MTRGYFPLALWNYTPVLHSMPALPIDDVCQDAVCVSFSVELIPYLLGLLEIYRWPDKFSGSPDEVQKSLGIIQDLVSILAEAEMCCCGDSQTVTNTQFLDNGVMQVSYDNGVTWQDAPAGVDPRQGVPISPPIGGADGDDKRCQAAGSAMHVLQDHQQSLANNALAWIGIEALVVAIIAGLVALEVVTGGIFSALLIPAAVAILAAGHAAFVAAFTDDVWAKVQCAIYCHTRPNGRPYTQGDVDAIRADLASELTGVAATWLDAELKTMGPNLLTNAARTGFISDFDCSGCDCLCENQFEVIKGTKLDTPYYVGYTSYQSQLVPDVGNQVIIQTGDIDECCTVLDVKFDLLGETGGGFSPFSGQVWLCGTDWEADPGNHTMSGSCLTKTVWTTHPILQAGDVFVMSVLWSDCP